MPNLAGTCPLSRKQVIDLYFMEHRAKLIDLAAFLDRVERGRGDDDPRDDFRIRQLLGAVAILTDGQGERARRVLDTFSDPTTQPLESAAGLKGASGAWAGHPTG
jgi:hypothetical protein